MPELARIESYDDLVHALRARVDQLGISKETLAALARLQGYSSDVLGLKPQGNMRSLGRMSFGVCSARSASRSYWSKIATH
jgi:hypothetical protein